jgi:ABC-type multidrug transport system fused ATPase/permease subunit
MRRHASSGGGLVALLVRSYWAAAEGHRRRALRFVFLVGLSALLEGLALATIIPLLSAADVPYHIGAWAFEGIGLRVLALSAFVTTALLSAGVRFAAETQSLRLMAEVEQGLRRRITGLLLRMKWASFLSLRLGDVNAATLVAANQITIGTQFFFRASGSALAAMILVLLSFAIAPKLALFTIALGLFGATCYHFASRVGERNARALSARADDLGSSINDIFANLKFFQSTGNVARSEQETSRAYHDYAWAWFRSQRYNPLMRFAFETGAVLFVGGVLSFALVTEGRFTPTAIVFLAIFARLLPRMIMTQEWLHIARIQRPWYDAWLERIDAIGEAPRHRIDGGRKPSMARSLDCQHVTFTFPGAERPALINVSWSLRRGDCVAFVGESGSGKTTMLDVVSGLLTPSTGMVSADGVPLAELDLEAWQSRIGIVMQTTPLFHESVLENVRWTEPELDRDRVMHCLELARAREFVERLPEAADTIIGESGGRLSGGERQRIAIARALYRDPWLLLLDEPTSALDVRSEEAVLAALESLPASLTTVVASHRNSTIGVAERVLVLEHGRVVADTSPEDLRAATSDTLVAAGAGSVRDHARRPAV